MNVKSYAEITALHVAAMGNRKEVINLEKRVLMSVQCIEIGKTSMIAPRLWLITISKIQHVLDKNNNN